MSYRIHGEPPQSHFWQVVAVIMTLVAVVLAFCAWHACKVNACDWAGIDNDPANTITDGNYVCVYDLGSIH